MRPLRAWIIRLGSLMSKTRVERDMADELDGHLQLHIEDNLRAGMTAEEARRRALIRLGGLDQTKEIYRDRRGAPMIETWWQDMRYGARVLAKSPGFTFTVVLALALGIGANTAIFSVVNGVLLRPLPYRDPSRLLVVTLVNEKTQETFPLCEADFLDWRSQNHVFSSVSAFSGNLYNLTGQGRPEQVSGDVVTADFLSTLAVNPLLGRTFLPNEDQPGSPPLVVLSYNFWQHRFGGASDIIGRAIVLNGVNTTVIGVMPPRFLPSPEQQLWTNLVIQPPTRRGPYFLTGTARLKPGVTEAQARAELSTIKHRIEVANPLTNAHMGFQITPLEEAVVGQVRPALLVLLGAVVLVMLIACADVANLLLARAASRHKEMAVRAALGASRFRILSQLLTESILLGGLGGLAGLLLARWGVQILLAASPINLPRLDEVGIDGRVLAFTGVISLAGGILFGLAPALQGGRALPHEALKEGGRHGTESRGRSRLRNALVVAEVALSLALLIGSGLMLRSFHKLETVNPGVDPRNVLTLHISLPDQNYRDDKRVKAFFQQLVTKVEQLPGVASAGVGMSLPPNLLSVTDNFMFEGQAPVSERELGIADLVFVSPDYFRTLGVPLIKGRYFTNHDRDDSPKVAIINETLARRYWPNESPLGKRIKRGGAERPDSPWMEVVGVVGNIKYSGLDALPEMALYVPDQQSSWATTYLAVRTSLPLSDPAELTNAVQNVVWSIDKDVPVAHVRTMEQLLSESVQEPRFRTALLGIFALIALGLAVVGIYGVLAYTVTQRRHEIGIRMALGAGRRRVLWWIVGQGMALTLIGVGLGLAAAFALTRFLASLLFGVRPTDWLTFIAVPVLLALAAFFACYVPARRATSLDPMEALRYE